MGDCGVPGEIPVLWGGVWLGNEEFRHMVRFPYVSGVLWFAKGVESLYPLSCVGHPQVRAGMQPPH